MRPPDTTTAPIAATKLRPDVTASRSMTDMWSVWLMSVSDPDITPTSYLTASQTVHAREKIEGWLKGVSWNSCSGKQNEIDKCETNIVSDNIGVVHEKR